MRGITALMTLLAVAAVLTGRQKPVTPPIRIVRPVPSPTPRLMQPLPTDGFLFFDIYMAAQIHYWLWSSPSGGYRRAMSEPADERTARLYEDMVARAKQAGFFFEASELRRTTIPTDLIFGMLPRRIFARHYPGPRYTLVDGNYVDSMEDSVLTCLLAHEFGHVVDVQNERIGHPLLERMAHRGSQEIADAFAIQLCGEENFRLLEQDRLGFTRPSYH